LSTGRLPFLVNLRRYPNIYGGGKELTQKVQEMDEFIHKIKEARKEVEEALSVMVCLDTNIFIFILSIFLDLIFLFF